MIFIINVPPQINVDRPLFNDILVKFPYLVGMIADKIFYNIFFMFFLSYGFGYGLQPKAEVFQGRTFGYGRR